MHSIDTDTLKTIKINILEVTYGVVFHAREYNIDHLCKGGFGGDLVVHVPGGEEDVITGADSQQHCALMDTHILGGDDCKQRLNTKET